MAIPSIPAYVGYTGFAKIDGTGTPIGSTPFGLRLTSADLKLKQAVDAMELISGKYDKVVYKLGPWELDGGMQFPAILDTDSDPVLNTWKLAILRNSPPSEPSAGRLYDFLIQLKYYAGATGGVSNATFNYNGCQVNSWEFSCTQGDVANINMNVFGTNRTENAVIAEPNYVNRNVRAVTWADCYVRILGDDGSSLVQSAQVRSFTGTIANNLARAYTFQGDNGNSLFPQDIYSKQRDISGSLVLMGRNVGLSTLAINNVGRCNANAQLKWGYQVFGTCNKHFKVTLPGVVFNIEEMSMGLDIIESTVNWRSMPGDAYNGAIETFLDA